jgi:predicted  nucleic acid-binding Zn-ribbon protein
MMVGIPSLYYNNTRAAKRRGIGGRGLRRAKYSLAIMTETKPSVEDSSPNPPHGSSSSSQEISDCRQTPDTEDTASVESDSTESTIEINNASMRLGDNPPNRTASLERQVQMLLKEAELREESMQMMTMELEQAQRKNEKRIDKLKSHLVKLSKELEDYPRQLQYWKEKSHELSKKVYTLEVELDEKKESIEDLVEYKYSQDVKIDSLEKEVEMLRLERRRDRDEEVVDMELLRQKQRQPMMSKKPRSRRLLSSSLHRIRR